MRNWSNKTAEHDAKHDANMKQTSCKRIANMMQQWCKLDATDIANMMHTNCKADAKLMQHSCKHHTTMMRTWCNTNFTKMQSSVISQQIWEIMVFVLFGSPQGHSFSFAKDGPKRSSLEPIREQSQIARTISFRWMQAGGRRQAMQKIMWSYIALQEYSNPYCKYDANMTQQNCQPWCNRWCKREANLMQSSCKSDATAMQTWCNKHCKNDAHKLQRGCKTDSAWLHTWYNNDANLMQQALCENAQDLWFYTSS